MGVMNSLAEVAPVRMPDIRSAALWVCALSLAGCGAGATNGDAPHAACPVYAACGGDLTGTWRIAGSCSGRVPADGPHRCDYTAWEETSRSGTMTFNGDGTYVTDVTSTITVTLEQPLLCGGGDGGAPDDPPAPLTCEDMDRALRDLMMTMPSYADSVSCTAKGDRCVCTKIPPPMYDRGHGTYESRDNRVIVAGFDRGAYCVKGDDLYIQEADPISVTDAGSSMHLVRTR
jgi:hypothetical protein